MTHSNKRKIDPEFGAEDLELPPLEDDTLSEPEQDVLTGALGEFEEIGSGEDDAEVSSITEREVVADLIATGEVSLLDDTPYGASLPMELDELDDEPNQPDESWVTPENDKQLAVDDLVAFDEETTESAIQEDSGAEGPVEEQIEIDTSGWDVLDATHLDEPAESVEQTMLRLGIELPSEDQSTGGSPREPSVVSHGECHFLGPLETPAAVRSLALGAGGPLAVGEAVYQIAADGLFHRMVEVHEIERALPTSCVAVGARLFVGTRTAGLFVIDLKARSVRPLNGWMSLGWAPAGAGHSSVSTSIRVYSLQRGAEPTIFVETEEGQIFASEDLGESWRGPLLHNKVLCAAVNQSSGELVVICDGDAGSQPTLQISRDLVTYDALALPQKLATTLSLGDRATESSREVMLVAAGETIAVGGVDQADRLWISLDHGASWRRDASEMRVTAVCIDPESPSWLAVACVGLDGRQGCLRISEDGGRHWTPAADRFEFEDAEGQPRTAGPIVELDLAVSATDRRVYAITLSGVFEIIVPIQDGVH